MSEVCKDFYALSVMGEVCQKNCKVNENKIRVCESKRVDERSSSQNNRKEMKWITTTPNSQNRTQQIITI